MRAEGHAAVPADAALLMAGGRSERMRAGGCAVHKALRTVRGTPLIEWNLRALLALGFRHIHVAVSAREPELLAWLRERGMPLLDGSPATLALHVEDVPLGTIGVAARLPPDCGDVVVVNVDNLTDLDLRALRAFHRRTGAAATVATHEHVFRMPFGRLELDGDRLVAYREKPGIPVQVSSGTYVLHPRAIALVPQEERMDVPQLIGLLLGRGERVSAFRHAAGWVDVNDEAALATADLVVGAPGWPGVVPAARDAASHV